MAEKVLVLRPDNLGDVVLFAGALRHLRALYPGAEVTLCVKRYVRGLVEACPHLDRLVYWEDLHPPLRRWAAPVPGLGRAVRRAERALLLRRYRADVALLPVHSPSAPMHETVALLGRRERYGIAGSHANQSPAEDAAAERLYTRRLRVAPERRWEHELAITRDFLRLLGADVPMEELAPEVWTTPADRAWVAGHLERVPGTVLLALSPGVTAPVGKAYPPALYAEALSGLTERRFSVVVLGSDADARICEETARAVASCANVESVRSLAGRTTVGRMAECLRAADVVLGADSAALHVAIAVGTRSVCVVGGGQFGRFHPWGDPGRHRVARKEMECYGCDWRCRFDTVRCVQEIPPATVERELRAALGAPVGVGAGGPERRS